MATIYPTLHEAIELHQRLIERFGGTPGVRDLGLLESALYRPRTGHYETLALQAAALMQSLAMNHPFVDGNKRVAFSLTAIFLRMNRYRLVVAPAEGESFVVQALIVRRASVDEISNWLAQRMSKCSP